MELYGHSPITSSWHGTLLIEVYIYMVLYLVKNRDKFNLLCFIAVIIFIDVPHGLYSSNSALVIIIRTQTFPIIPSYLSLQKVKSVLCSMFELRTCDSVIVVRAVVVT
jgi:hypothetical protein